MRRLLLAAGLLLAICMPGVAAASPASPTFLAQWKQADQLYAHWDLLAAERTLHPLLPQAASLEGYQRIWFDFSAGRLLAVIGRYQDALPFINDSAAIVGRRTCSDTDGTCTQSTGYVFWKHPGTTHCIHGASLGPEMEIDDYVPADAWSEAWFRNSAVEFDPHAGQVFPKVPGLYGFVDSYFGGEQTFPWRPEPVTWCDVLLARLSGGPTGPQSNTSHHIVVIPTAERIIGKRSVPVGAAIPVQAFEVGASKLIATWTPARGGKKLQFRYSVIADRASLRAPRTRGIYNLQLGVGSKRDFATGVTKIRVGMR